MGDQLAPTTRHKYMHNDRVVYEWDQTLTEVNIYVEVPSGVTSKMLYCDIQKQHIRIGIKPNPPYLDLDLSAQVRVDDCTWTLDGTALEVYLSKLNKGETWQAAFTGHELNLLSAEEDKKRLMLERYQEENPGFDFSNATFNGQVPDPQTFMGGIKQ